MHYGKMILKRTERGELSLTDAGISDWDVAIGLQVAASHAVACFRATKDASDQAGVKRTLAAVEDVTVLARYLHVNLRPWLRSQ